MRRVQVGYQDGTIYPLWLVNTGMRLARWFGADSLWVQDHYMGFIPAQVWKPEITEAAKVVHSPDGCFDALQILTATAKKRGAVGAVINGFHRDTPKVLEQHWPVFSRGQVPPRRTVRQSSPTAPDLGSGCHNRKNAGGERRPADRQAVAT